MIVSTGSCLALWDGRSTTLCVFCGAPAAVHVRMPESAALAAPPPLLGWGIVARGVMPCGVRR